MSSYATYLGTLYKQYILIFYDTNNIEVWFSDLSTWALEENQEDQAEQERLQKELEGFSANSVNSSSRVSFDIAPKVKNASSNKKLIIMIFKSGSFIKCSNRFSRSSEGSSSQKGLQIETRFALREWVSECHASGQGDDVKASCSLNLWKLIFHL